MKKILYGVSGIGNGHANRELAIIETLSKKNKIMIFAYDDSLKTFQRYLSQNTNVTLVPIAVPFYVGSKTGIDFAATANAQVNQGVDFLKINACALDRVEKELGKPDLVITDYEPISAQYAYAYDIPLVTIDQQSKFLIGDLPEEINGFSFADEIVRLHMFFPKASARIACSFFSVTPKERSSNVLLFPPTIKESIVQLKREPSENEILVYITSAREFVQSVQSVVEVCSQFPEKTFHIFVTKTEFDELKTTAQNIHLYQHGDPVFQTVLGRCVGIISTAGHTLFSEAMYLQIPVYAIPVYPYEQHLNAYILEQNQLGISRPKIEIKDLQYFIEHIPVFTENIKKDTKVLLRGVGQEKIIDFLEKKYLQNA